ncbi:DUF4834 family protein [Marinilabiliaceae bacterium JC017]|nr:DUF4834 family protein [Marinilabiliaceae bacterium JC017]
MQKLFNEMLVGLFRTILFLVIFYYLFKILGRLALPFLVKKGAQRMQNQQQQAYQQYRQQQKQQEGKVTIQQEPKNSSTQSAKAKNSEGEYVDFEEVN